MSQLMMYNSWPSLKYLPPPLLVLWVLLYGLIVVLRQMKYCTVQAALVAASFCSYKHAETRVVVQWMQLILLVLRWLTEASIDSLNDLWYRCYVLLYVMFLVQWNVATTLPTYFLSQFTVSLIVYTVFA